MRHPRSHHPILNQSKRGFRVNDPQKHGPVRVILRDGLPVSSPESQPQGSPVGGGSRFRHGERNEGPAESPTVPSAKPMHGE